MLNTLRRKLLNREVILYLIFGILTTIVDTLVFFIFDNIISINYIISTCFAWIFAVLFAYVTNKMFVFSIKSTTNTLMREMLSFFSLRFVSLLMSLIFMFILVDFLSIYELLSKVLVNFLVVVSNYIFSKLFVFK